MDSIEHQVWVLPEQTPLLLTTQNQNLLPSLGLEQGLRSWGVVKNYGGCIRGVRGKTGGDAEVHFSKLPDLQETTLLLMTWFACSSLHRKLNQSNTKTINLTVFRNDNSLCFNGKMKFEQKVMTTNTGKIICPDLEHFKDEENNQPEIHWYKVVCIGNILFKMCYEVTVKNSFWKGRFIFSRVWIRHLSCYTIGKV